MQTESVTTSTSAIEQTIDERIVALCKRYEGLTLHALMAFLQILYKAAERHTSKLQRNREGQPKQLRSIPLLGKKRLYISINAKPHRGKQALLRSVATGSLFAFHLKAAKHLTAEEFKAAWPQLVIAGVSSSNYHVENGVLYLRLVHHGGKVRRLRVKAKKQIEARLENKLFAQLAAAKRFALLIITYNENHKKKIEKALAGSPWQFSVVVVPEYSFLLFGD